MDNSIRGLKQLGTFIVRAPGEDSVGYQGEGRELSHSSLLEKLFHYTAAPPGL